MDRFEIRGPKSERRMKMKRLAVSAVILGLGLLLVACERRSIGEINADPGRFMNQEVVVAGTVTQSIGALGHGVYEVNDGTGSIWVYANSRGVPSKGASVGVKGRVVPTVTFLGINYATVMRETDRRFAHRG
jgi:hypothetical protein